MSRGFSLIEMLVALVVLSIGLLGAAALLVGGVRDQSLAVRHGAAAVLVADMAERIRANPGARELYSLSDTSTGIVTDTAEPAEGTVGADCAELAPCGVAALAAQDLAHFQSSVHALLPAQRPRARISFEPATGPATADRFRISVAWNDARDPDATDEITTLILLAWPVAGAA